MKETVRYSPYTSLLLNGRPDVTLPKGSQATRSLQELFPNATASGTVLLLLTGEQMHPDDYLIRSYYESPQVSLVLHNLMPQIPEISLDFNFVRARRSQGILSSVNGKMRDARGRQVDISGVFSTDLSDPGHIKIREILDDDSMVTHTLCTTASRTPVMRDIGKPPDDNPWYFITAQGNDVSVDRWGEVSKGALDAHALVGLLAGIDFVYSEVVPAALKAK